MPALLKKGIFITCIQTFHLYSKYKFCIYFKYYIYNFTHIILLNNSKNSYQKNISNLRIYTNIHHKNIKKLNLKNNFWRPQIYILPKASRTLEPALVSYLVCIMQTSIFFL